MAYRSRTTSEKLKFITQVHSVEHAIEIVLSKPVHERAQFVELFDITMSEKYFALANEADEFINKNIPTYHEAIMHRLHKNPFVRKHCDSLLNENKRLF